MAFPFMKFPTFAEFIEMLRAERGILLKDLDGDLTQNDVHLSVHFLEGAVDGKTVRCAVDIQDYDATMSPSVHRSICTRFGLDQESFASKVANSHSKEDPPQS